MPLIETRGAGSAQGFGEFAQSAAPVYIEDVFSTYLYTGNGSTQTITNGIDLSGKGGLVWIKGRSLGYSHYLANTNRGASKYLATNRSDAENYNGNYTDTLTSFNSNGFSLGADSLGSVNTSGDTYASWTFRKQAKFFDVVTYTGAGGTQNISHNLGSTPGCIIVKCTSNSGSWRVYHRSESTKYGSLNSTAAFQTTNAQNVWGDNSTTVAPTSTQFTVGSDSSLNGSGETYVAYLFAHDAGGFGLSGLDNVISCGSYTGTGAAGNPITLGYEPQWVLIKRTDSTGDWNMQDIMRQMSLTNNLVLYANLSNAEFDAGGAIVYPTATGFTCGTGSAGWNASGGTYIYIAIRRGPMKTPTSGTSVFSPQIWTGTGTTQQITTGFFPDMFIGINRGAVHAKTYATDILRGLSVTLATNVTDAENSESGNTFNMTGYSNNNGNLNSTFGGGQTYVGEFFRRAPGFMDVVCYTGTGANQTLNHNLGVAPELIIIKSRNGAIGWDVNTSFTSSGYSRGALNSSTQFYPQTYPDTITAQPTATQFSVSSNIYVGANFYTYVAYLFASCPGVSKVGTYTGTGTTLQIDCGFTGGARFVLIKRTDSTGDWYVYDSARGIVSGNDPYLLLNSTAAEVTNTDYVDTYSAGFELSSTAPAALNANGGTYIFLAIA